MDAFHCPQDLIAVDDAGDVDLAGPLRDHLDVDVVVAENGEKLTCNANGLLEIKPDQTDDGHVAFDIHSAIVFQFSDAQLQVMVGNVRPLLTLLTSLNNHGILGVHRQAHMHLVQLKEVHLKRVPI